MPAKSKGSNDQRVGRIATSLAQLYPQARISLDFAGARQCLVATLLSEHWTDERVKNFTPNLFE